ncbi:MAG: histidine kinase [Oscillospiraceae bacterium]|nr:histidine kinase [Oscillospiraceae bacterium]
MRLKSIRMQLSGTIVAFTLLIMLVFSGIILRLFTREQRDALVQRTEFNLQLVTGMMDQNLERLQTLSGWSVGNASVTMFLRNPASSSMDSINIYTRVNEEWLSNRAGEYVNRLIITDGEDKLIQVGNAFLTAETPLVLYYMREALRGLAQDASLNFYIGTDTLSNRQDTQVLIFLRPIVLGDTGKTRGLSYMVISTDVITDQLKNYNLQKGDKLYLTLGDVTYEITDKEFIPIETVPAYAVAEADPLNSETLIFTILDGDTSRTVVSYPLSGLPNCYLSHNLAPSPFIWQRSSYYTIFISMLILVVLLGLCLGFYMHFLISRRVIRLRRRIATIAQGHFERDDTIEWENELGDIGRGINALSHDVAQLMETRLADEKAKRDLEYKMLQNQINPHFIYNTLNSIKWMATIQNATGIAEMTTAFSHLLKSVAKGNEELITLRDEFALLNDYCIIQQYRYGGSITLEIAEITDETFCECLIPRFTLQPLAENAIFHGIEPKGGLGNIWLHIFGEENGGLCVVMEDNGVGMTPETIHEIFAETEDESKAKFKQIGVRNVHRRIQYAFGEQYGIEIESQPGAFTRMKIHLPCRYQSPQEVAHD